MWKEPDIGYFPRQWLLFFPLGLLVVSAMSLLIFISWPPYLVYRLGRWTYSLLGEV